MQRFNSFADFLVDVLWDERVLMMLVPLMQWCSGRCPALLSAGTEFVMFYCLTRLVLINLSRMGLPELNIDVETFTTPAIALLCVAAL